MNIFLIKFYHKENGFFQMMMELSYEMRHANGIIQINNAASAIQAILKK